MRKHRLLIIAAMIFGPLAVLSVLIGNLWSAAACLALFLEVVWLWRAAEAEAFRRNHDADLKAMRDRQERSRRECDKKLFLAVRAAGGKVVLTKKAMAEYDAATALLPETTPTLVTPSMGTTIIGGAAVLTAHYTNEPRPDLGDVFESAASSVSFAPPRGLD